MPKKAQKGGGGKDGGKTGEKRLQQRAQTKEEMAKKREEILKDKLQREEKMTAANLLKVNERWRSILRQTKDLELRDDIMVLKQTFERKMDSLDSTIKNLGCDLQESERQAASARRLHMQHVEHLRDLQDKRLLLLQQQRENSLQQIRSTFDSERKQMLVQSEQLKADLEDVMLAAEQRHNKVMEEIDTLYNEENKSNKSAANMKSAMITKELVMEKTGQNQEAAQACSNEQKNQECIGQINKDMMTVKSLPNLGRGLQESERQAASARRLHMQHVEHLRDLQDKRLLLLQQQGENSLQQIRSTFDSERKQMLVQPEQLKADLEDIMLAAEQHHNKVMEEIDTLYNEENKSYKSAANMKEASSEFPKQRRVTQSINTAILQRKARKKRIDDLSQENQQLTLQLSQHLEAMKVSNDTFDGRQAPTATGQPDTDGRHVVKRSPKD